MQVRVLPGPPCTGIGCGPVLCRLPPGPPKIPPKTHQSPQDPPDRQDLLGPRIQFHLDESPDETAKPVPGGDSFAGWKRAHHVVPAPAPSWRGLGGEALPLAKPPLFQQAATAGRYRVAMDGDGHGFLPSTIMARPTAGPAAMRQPRGLLPPLSPATCCIDRSCKEPASKKYLQEIWKTS